MKILFVSGDAPLDKSNEGMRCSRKCYQFGSKLYDYCDFDI